MSNNNSKKNKIKITGNLYIETNNNVLVVNGSFSSSNVSMYWHGNELGGEGGEFDAQQFGELILKFYNDDL